MVKNYLCIESQSAFEAAGTGHYLSLARDLKKQGHGVEVLLIQNGVFSARADANGLGDLMQAGVQVWADDFSLRERAISNGGVKRGIRATPISLVIDRMAAGWNVLWH